jgi:Chaperone of endosialidase
LRFLGSWRKGNASSLRIHLSAIRATASATQEKAHIMSFTRQLLAAALVASCIASAANATQPPDVVVSDTTGGNTAMGTGALLNMNGGAIENTAAGYGTLNSTTSGSYNSALGEFALGENITGSYNTAIGQSTLALNSVGSFDTALGSGALSFNTGSYNTASGYDSLYANATGYQNTAAGAESLALNTTGYSDTAVGFQSLFNNSTGHQNGAMGFQALFSNTTGSNNIATGANSLRANTTGESNVGLGVATLQNTTTGQNNLAVGANALNQNVGGSNNTAIGANAGLHVTGKNNIDIGNEGMAGESGAIRIGTPSSHTTAFIAGIYTVESPNSLPVYINSAGLLGTKVSSERFKIAIAPMGLVSEKLAQLRPVTFHLKTDPAGSLQYGLIAEEVAKVYPDLVVRDPAGRIDGVRYDELAPMLLNEMQRQAAEIVELKQQTAEIAVLKQQIAQMAAAMLQTSGERMASR